MKSFKLDMRGDLIVDQSGVAMVSDGWLIAQSVKTVLLSNIGEWWLNLRYGIDHYSMLGKKPNKTIARENINLGLRQIDPSFLLEKCDIKFDSSTRLLSIDFEAVNSAGMRVREVLSFGTG